MSYRQILAVPETRPGQPGRIVMDVYEDGYSPLDVLAGLTLWMMEEPDITERFRQYVEENTEMVTGGEFTAEDAIMHLSVLHRLVVTMWRYPGHNIYVQGNEGWVN